MLLPCLKHPCSIELSVTVISIAWVTCSACLSVNWPPSQKLEALYIRSPTTQAFVHVTSSQVFCKLTTAKCATLKADTHILLIIYLLKCLKESDILGKFLLSIFEII